MSAFTNMKLTNNGKDLIARSLIGHEIEFTSIKMGDGTFTGEVETLNDLVSTKQTLSIYNVRKYDTNRMLVGSVLQGSQVTEGFFWKEIGIYAHDKTLNDTPVLFAYDNAGSNASFIPAGGSVVEQVINVELMVSNTANVTALINESLVYLIKKDPDFIGTLLSGGVKLITVNDTRTIFGDKIKDMTLNAKTKVIANVNGKDYEVFTEERIIISDTQPSPVPGKNVLWFDSSNS